MPPQTITNADLLRFSAEEHASWLLEGLLYKPSFSLLEIDAVVAAAVKEVSEAKVLGYREDPERRRQRVLKDVETTHELFTPSARRPERESADGAAVPQGGALIEVTSMRKR
jgi:hypothetical protein